MARRRRSTRKSTNSRTDAPELRQPQVEAGSKDSSGGQPGKLALNANRIILVVVLLVFVIFEISIILIFQSGEEIRWKKDLVEVDTLFEDGEYQAAADGLAQFGEDWPGAKATFEWNRKMGLYHARAEDWETAAEYYLRAAEIDPKAPGVHARAGEALWMAGKREEALPQLQSEIEDINRSVGEHDRANYYLGLELVERKMYPQAFQHFQAIADREAWDEKLDDVYTRVGKELLEPAREKAGKISLAQESTNNAKDRQNDTP